MVLAQLFAATTQDRDAGGGQAAPPHPAVTDMVLDCVPALAASAREGVQEQELQPHWQFLGALPVQSRRVFVFSGQCSLHVLVCSPDAPQVFGEQVLQGVHTHGHGFVPVFCWLVEQSPVLQPALQVLVWVKVWPEQCVEVAGDHGSAPQTTVVGPHDLVPLALRLVAQSPMLQSAGQVLVCVKDCPEQTVEAAGDHKALQPTHVLVPFALRLVEQSPVLQPALQVLVCVKDWPEQTVEIAGNHEAPQRTHDFVPLALRLVAQSPVLQPLLQVLVWVKDRPEQTVEAAGDHEAVPQLTGATGFSAEHTPEFDPPLLPSQRHW